MVSTRVIDTARRDGAEPRHVWYTSYGSNTHLDRLTFYLAGGRPPGASRTYPGCRDRRPPAASVPVRLDGALYFATRSPVWAGGRAFYDPEAGGRVLARAHLVTVEQFSDIAAQEMYREPGVDLDLSGVLSSGRAVLGAGRYETLICPGTVDGVPALTFTAPWGVNDVPWVKPSAAYVRYLATGLLGAGGFDGATIASYVANCPGAAGHWTAREVEHLIGRGRPGP
ncbi:histone deacetylase [Streptomyces agglomeratus]|uniref:Histone deacetylase n=1 Tax=Streptomyces agglomeratus TaxID=285458 RepID=A0A1E5P643_9ACTN|nr:histone deacetylase [Streptomyces agglomeratus]OEJ25038.1 histone deacetylase [Streptomyces agglomeratus]OEJ40938.1 histone deacetylase [Streptomyces agglomeratus]OEJ44685.1 histone deacetylase [Streptomyces agglomeratus]OEJ53473.1 histone deacetylase [Streptomyces agglomeratus]OEJ60813.1 histone deacetylase [Streptomyces agglomeratus]